MTQHSIRSTRLLEDGVGCWKSCSCVCNRLCSIVGRRFAAGDVQDSIAYKQKPLAKWAMSVTSNSVSSA